MDAEQILRNLDIELDGEYNSNGQYVADILSSSMYLKVYSRLDKSDKLDELVDNNLITEHNVSVAYLYSEVDAEIVLVADLDNDEYKIIVNQYVYEDENEDVIDEEE